jgi:molybdate/tungstate transport system ATP-binding protein
MKNVFRAEVTGERTRVGPLEVKTGGGAGNGAGHIAIRPEDVKVLTGARPPEEANAFRGKVTGILDQGFTYEVLVGVGALTFRSLMTKKALFRKDIREGSDVFVCFSPDAVHRF